MAVVNKSSAAITKRDAPPSQTNSTLAPTKVATGRVKESLGVIQAANGDSIGSILRYFAVHSSWRVSAIRLSCNAVTGAAADVGLYDMPTRNSGAVVDADFFASAQSLASALDKTDITRESGLITVAKLEQPLWQLLGLAQDPGVWYDVAATLTAAATADGYTALHGYFIDGN